MKVLVVFLLTVSVALAAMTAEQIAKVEPISKKCREETGATVEQVNKVRKEGFFTDDPIVKKQILCMLKKTEICKDGKLNVEKIRTIGKNNGASDEEIASVIACEGQQESEEERAYQFLKCAMKTHKKFSVV